MHAVAHRPNSQIEIAYRTGRRRAGRQCHAGLADRQSRGAIVRDRDAASRRRGARPRRFGRCWLLSRRSRDPNGTGSSRARVSTIHSITTRPNTQDRSRSRPGRTYAEAARKANSAPVAHAFGATQRVVGGFILVLGGALLVPVPLSNVPPSLVIALIAGVCRARRRTAVRRPHRRRDRHRSCGRRSLADPRGCHLTLARRTR